MPLSSSILSYPDIRNAFDQAVDSVKGIRIKFDDIKAAHYFSRRCNAFRALDRKENKKIYADDPAHSLFGRSVYDTISIRVVPIEGGGAYVQMEKIKSDRFTVEAIE